MLRSAPRFTRATAGKLAPTAAIAQFPLSHRQVREGASEETGPVGVVPDHDDLAGVPRGPGVRSIAAQSPPRLPPKTSQPEEPTRACTAPLGEV